MGVFFEAARSDFSYSYSAGDEGGEAERTGSEESGRCASGIDERRLFDMSVVWVSFAVRCKLSDELALA